MTEHPFVGRYFHIFGEDEKAEQHGVVRAALGDGFYLVKIFESDVVNVLHVSEMQGNRLMEALFGPRACGSWQFYEDEQQMNAWLAQNATAEADSR